MTAKLVRHGGFIKLMDITQMVNKYPNAFVPPPSIVIPFYQALKPFDLTGPMDLSKPITTTMTFLRTGQDEHGIYVYEEDGKASGYGGKF